MLLNMGAELPVLLQGGPLQLLGLSPLQPIGDGLGDGRAAAGGGMGAGADIDRDLGVVGVGVLPAFKGGGVPLAVTVAIVDEPRRAGFPALGFPGAAADAHFQDLEGRAFSSRERGRVTLTSATISFELPITTSRS